MLHYKFKLFNFRLCNFIVLSTYSWRCMDTVHFEIVIKLNILFVNVKNAVYPLIFIEKSEKKIYVNEIKCISYGEKWMSKGLIFWKWDIDRTLQSHFKYLL